MRLLVDLSAWMMMLLLLVLLPLLLAADSSSKRTTTECPQKCVCFMMHVRCMFQKLSQMPRVPVNTTVLDLRFNSITEVRPGTFRGLDKLHTLLLNDNHIRRLAAGAFEGAPNLRILYLYKNRIEQIAPGAFARLPRLEQLYLHHNHLREIRPGTFNDLPALERLFLHSNKLHRLPADAFVNVGPMTRLRLDSNALVCDCNLVWLVERTRDRPTEMAAICQSPHKMKGRSLTTMLPEDFHCTKPRIIEGPEDTAVRFGETMTLKCRVTGDPTPKIKWMKDKWRYSEADDDDSEKYVIREDGEKYVIREDGTLVITDMTEQDSGVYECVASSDMGSTKSRKARAVITATSHLIFAEKPESQNVTAGANVTFSCRALSRPRPNVRWLRDDQPIPFSDRISLANDDTTLRILAVKETDAGKYQCHLRSVDRSVVLFADLGVIDFAAPRLIFKPQDMEAEPDATVEVPCRAEGRPKPVIQWKKDGSALDNNRIKITRGGSLLIFNVIPLDTGRYECSAINHYGRITADALVRVRQSGATDTLVIRAFLSATEEIDRAINKTLLSLFNPDGSSRHVNPFRLARFPNAISRAAARPAELFERTLVNIRRMVNAGAKANVIGEFGYEEILTHEQVKEIEQLSGCIGHRHRQNCTNRCFHRKYRTIDGSCNNLRHPIWGSSHTGFRRVLQPIYENGFSTPVSWEKERRYYGYPKPAARLVSNTQISTHDLRELTTDHGLLREDPTIPSLKPLLPYAAGQFVDCRRNPLESSINCFVAGDIRANEQIGLLAMHTIWLREHNRIARALREMNPHWNGGKLYQEARRIVGAEMQHITYQHWLPRIFGPTIDEFSLSYRGYDPNVDASISNVFATAALRFGSLAHPAASRASERLVPADSSGCSRLRDALFAPWRLMEEGGVIPFDPLIRGIYATAAKLKLNRISTSSSPSSCFAARTRSRWTWQR